MYGGGVRRTAPTLLLGAALVACGEGKRSDVEVEQVSADDRVAAPLRVPPPEVTVTAARNAEEAARAVAQTHAVMSALMAETTLDSSGLRVATDEPLKQVLLVGRVPSARQRALAEQLARDKAPGYELKNGLEVSAD
jgi:hypothetical protein